VIVSTWCGAVGCVQLAGDVGDLAPSSKAGPQPVWVIMVASTQGHRFGLAYKVTYFV
jgi:hypothetical protein